MANFLAEAAAVAARKPHVLYETQQAILGPVLGRQAPGFSLLATAALQQSVKVASSAKMPAQARAAICGYVAGMLSWPAFDASGLVMNRTAVRPADLQDQTQSACMAVRLAVSLSQVYETALCVAVQVFWPGCCSCSMTEALWRPSSAACSGQQMQQIQQQWIGCPLRRSL